jgi:hypothetical protein
MGDRFYQQQLAATGDCPGASETQRRKKKSVAGPTKSDIVAKLPVDLSALTKRDLELVVSSLDSCLGEFEMPEGRLKRPYVTELNKLDSRVSWNKLTVAKMKELIEWLLTQNTG